jgi:[acyl-carrier-protein] S-malonyltransferase
MRAFAFPGQGSQYVGMGLEIYERYDFVREIYEEGEKISGKPIRKISFEGPEEDLTRTENTQPAIFVYSVALLEVLKRKGIEADVVFGHSLGEFSALYSAGVFSFETTLKLVVKRGELMGRAKGGKMVALIGKDAYKRAEEVMKELNPQKTVIANINSPLQVVISGDEREVDEIVERIKSMAKDLRLIPLKVSTAFHSPLMDEAAKEFSEILENVEFMEPKVPIIMNSTGKIAKSSKEVYNALKVQLRSPVLFVDMINTAIEVGVDEAWEVGPKKVLCGLISQITDEIKTFSGEEYVKV